MALLLVLVLLLSLPRLGVSATFYVHPNGSNGNSCTTASQAGGCAGASTCARQTLQAGSACLSGGDTLIVRGGTYTNQCLGDFATADVSPIPAGTSWAAPTTIRNQTGETVTIVSSQQCDGDNSPITMAMDSSQYIVIDGINLTGNGTFQGVGLGPTRLMHFKNMVISHFREGIAGAPQDCIFENITTRYSGYNASMQDVCPVPELGCHGIYIQGRDPDNYPNYHTTGNLFTRITAHDNTGLGITISCEGCGQLVHDNIVERSVVYNNKSYGILTYPNNTTRNSMSYNNFVGIAGDGHVYNNTVVDNTTPNTLGDRANLGIFIGGGGGQIVRNNIAVGNPDGDIASSGSGATYSHNVCGSLNATYGCAQTATPTALFENYGGKNFHLKATATAAIDRGVTLSQVTDDFDGQPRSGTYDIGADEVGGGAAPVATALAFEPPQLAGTTVGATIPTFTVRVLDQFGALFSSSASISLVLGNNPGGGTLQGTTTRTASGGIATFDNLSLTAAGTGYSLIADTAAPDLPPVTSSPFNITTPQPVYLSWMEDPPATTPAGSIITPVIAGVFDAAGTLVTTSNALVTIALDQNPAGGTLSGDTSKNAVNGIVTFTDLTVNTVGTGYTFRVSSPPLTSGQSGFFAITPAAPSVLNPPTQLRSLEDTITANGQIRLGWDYTQGSTLATGFVVQRQEACTGAWTDRPNMPMPVGFQMGVSLAGADFGAELPGQHYPEPGSDYVYPDPDYWPGYTGQTYFQQKGLTTFRLGIKHERLQQTLGGALDAAELTRLTTTVNNMTELGQITIIEATNFARYNIGGTLHIVGSATFTNAHFADFWSRVANVFKTNPLVEYDLTNEPNQMPTNQWLAAANAAIAAIRATGSTQPIHVEGNGYSHAFTWTDGTGTYYPPPANGTALLNITDSANQIVYHPHEYLQPDPSQSPEGQGCASATIGSERLAPFTSWLRANNKKGFLGEFGSDASATCLAAIADVMRYVRANSDVYTGWAWYAGGPWWGTYEFSLEPNAGPVDKAQMDAMEPFLAEAAGVAQTYTDTGLSAANTYCWRVQAVDGAGNRSTPSNTYQWPTTIPPPTDLSVTTLSTGFFINSR